MKIIGMTDYEHSLPYSLLKQLCFLPLAEYDYIIARFSSLSILGS